MSTNSSNHSVKRHVRGSTLLLAGRGISMLLNLAVQVVMVRHLPLEAYGSFAFVMAVISLASSCTVFGLDKTAARILPILDEQGHRRQLMGVLLAILASISLLGFAEIVLIYTGYLVAPHAWVDAVSFQLLVAMSWLIPINALEAVFLAVLSSLAGARSVFVRRHVLGPGLKLAAVVVVVGTGSDVLGLAYGYLAGSVLALVVDIGVMLVVCQRKSLLGSRPDFGFPLREIFGYGGSFFLSDMIHLLHSTSPLLFIQYFGGNASVAAFRSVLPVARLNEVVRSNFAYLFLPATARLFAQQRHRDLNDLYWRTAVWVLLLGFPVFVMTFVFAGPLTVLLFGEAYRSSAQILSVLATGYYCIAALGFNTQTLRTYGQIRFAAWADVAALIASLAGFVLVIPWAGALGAAYVMSGVLILHALVNQGGLLLTSTVDPWPRRFARPYVSVMLATLGLMVGHGLGVNLVVKAILAIAATVVVLVLNRDLLELHDTFPELMKIPGARWLAGTHRSTPAATRSSPGSDATEQQILAHMTVRAREYDQAFRQSSSAIAIHVEARDRRSASTLLHVVLQSADHRLATICKIPHALPTEGPVARPLEAPRRPRNVPLVLPGEVAGYEATALIAIEKHLAAAPDARFRAVRVLDYLPEFRANVIEHLPWPSLNTLLKHSCLGSEQTKAEVIVACQQAGAWLARFHAMRCPEHTKTWRTTADDFSSSTRELLAYLVAQQSLTAAESAEIETALTVGVDAVLPRELPCGVTHGDFAPRNVLVGPAAQVAVIDTLAWLKTPIYRDLACFLVSMEVATMRVYSRRWVLSDPYLRRLDQAFLAGYFPAGDAPLAVINLFCLQAILEKWAAEAEHYRRSHGACAWGRWMMKSRFFKQVVLDRLPATNFRLCEVA